MKSFMIIVGKFAEAKDCWIKNPGDWDIRIINTMWVTIKPEFTAKYCQSNRKKEMTWKIAYNNMSNQNAFDDPKNKLSRG